MGVTRLSVWIAGFVLAAAVMPAAAAAGAISLRMTAGDGEGHRRSATLRCDGSGAHATGYLRGRGAARLCRRAYRLEAFLAARPPTGRACTLVYGGPDRAVIRGNIRNKAIARRFARTDGCEIADWDRAQALLPRPAGAA